ncbi:tRNA adenosine(34) deaminase TadA [Buchnera aphidicola]|uniref:tRNA adenosine(34) deaminase TadA n=1 Tax=Buchnera aphidicola TaxID=9 RepID=UPI0034648AA9
MQDDQDKYWMKIALKNAYYAKKKGEVPIGAIVVFEKRIIGRGRNSSISQNDPTAHAEIIALRRAGKKIKNYRLLNTTLYVTLQPCIMCCGAIINSRIKRLVFGTSYKKKYFLENFFLDLEKKNKFHIKKNVMENQCSKILSNFFKKKRC